MARPSDRIRRKRGTVGIDFDQRNLQNMSRFFSRNIDKPKALVAQIFFPTAGHSLCSDDRKQLKALINFFKSKIDSGFKYQFDFIGHADKRYYEDYNDTLSDKRAFSVYDYVIKEIPKVQNSSRYRGEGERFSGDNLADDRRVDVCATCTAKPPTPTSLTILVVNAEDNPLNDARVHITQEKGYRTNAKGIVKIINIPAGSVTVSAWKPDYSEGGDRTTIKANFSNQFKVILKKQRSASLPVLVIDQDNKIIVGAKVSLNPAPNYRTPGCYKEIIGHTKELGMLHFDGLRHNTYLVEASKDGVVSPQKRVEIRQAGLISPAVKLTINLKKKLMSIWIESAAWAKGGIAPFFWITMTAVFGVEDKETRGKAYYRGTFKIFGCEASKELIKWVPVGKTTGPGPARMFYISRRIGTKETDEAFFKDKFATLDLAQIDIAGQKLLDIYNLRINHTPLGLKIADVPGLKLGPTNVAPPPIASVAGGVSIDSSRLYKL